MSKLIKDENAFTLIELIIAMALAVVITAAISFTFVGMTRSSRFSYGQSHNAMSAQNILGTIGSLLRYADKDSVNVTMGQTADKVQFTILGSSVKIEIDDSTMVITQGVKEMRMARGQVQNLTFTRDATDARKMTVTLSLQSDQSDAGQTMTLGTTVMMLNM